MKRPGRKPGRVPENIEPPKTPGVNRPSVNGAIPLGAFVILVDRETLKKLLHDYEVPLTTREG